MGKVNLEGLRIVETKAIHTAISDESKIRYLIKEDYLYYNGEGFNYIEKNKYGSPKFITNDLKLAKTKIEELEFHYFIDIVLDNLQSSRYWKDTIYLEQEMLNEIELKLSQKGISLNYQKDSKSSEK